MDNGRVHMEIYAGEELFLEKFLPRISFSKSFPNFL